MMESAQVIFHWNRDETCKNFLQLLSAHFRLAWNERGAKVWVICEMYLEAAKVAGNVCATFHHAFADVSTFSPAQIVCCCSLQLARAAPTNNSNSSRADFHLVFALVQVQLS